MTPPAGKDERKGNSREWLVDDQKLAQEIICFPKLMKVVNVRVIIQI